MSADDRGAPQGKTPFARPDQRSSSDSAVNKLLWHAPAMRTLDLTRTGVANHVAGPDLNTES